MKLKLVVASMSALALISCPVFAADQVAAPQHKHHKVHHKMVAHNLKGEESMTPAAPMASDWFNRIALEGGINADTKIGSLYNTNGPAYLGENNQRMSLNNAYVNVKADVNEWAKAFVGFSFSNPSENYTNTFNNSVNSFGNNGGLGVVTLEQAYINIANASVTPAYVKIGKQYTDFGMYDAHALIQTTTGTLSESLENAITVGFDAPMNGVNIFGSVYGYNDNATQVGNATPKMNGGARLGIGQTNDQLGWNVSADYLNSFTGVQNVSASLVTPNTYNTRVGAGAINAGINSGGFSLTGRYVQALTSFNQLDLVSTNIANGAKPSAGNLTAGYGFNAMNVDQNVSVAYDITRDAVNLQLPRDRWTAAYDVHVLKNTVVGAEFNHDRDYSTSNTGTGTKNNQFGVRVAVKFS
jgi:hypothetical protein